MKKAALIIGIIFLAGCAAGYTSTKADYVCPVPPSMPVEKPQVVEPVKIVPVPVVEKKTEAPIAVLPFYFDFDKSNVKGQEQAVDLAVTAMNRNAASKARLEGNCDKKGSVKYNERLGLRRAESVKKLMVGKGIDPKRISTSSLGKSKATGNDAQDRRVDIIIQ